MIFMRSNFCTYENMSMSYFMPVPEASTATFPLQRCLRL